MVEGSKEKDSVKSRSSRQDVFCKKGVLKSFAICTGKCLPWSLFFIKLQVFSEQHYPQNLLGTNFLLSILQNSKTVFKKHHLTIASERALDFTKILGKFLSTSTNLLLVDPGRGGNKVVQVRNIVRHFYLSYFRRVVNSTINRTFLGVRYKNRIS